MYRIPHNYIRIWVLSSLLFLVGCGKSRPHTAEQLHDATPATIDSEAVPPTKSAEAYQLPSMTDFEIRKKIEQSQFQLSRGDFEGAFEKINLALESAKNNDFAEALSLRALIHFGRENIPAAVADLNLAIMISDGEIKAKGLSMRGTLFTAAYSSDENPFLLLLALADHQKSEFVSKRVEDSLTSQVKKLTITDLANSFAMIGQSDLEETENEEAPTLTPRIRAGLQDLLDQKFQQAEKAFTEEIELKPEEVMALVGRAVAISCTSKDYRRILEDLKQAISSNTELAVADDLLLYHQVLPPVKVLALSPSPQQRRQKIQSLAEEHGFPPEAAERLGVHVDIVITKWGALNKPQRVGQIFAGMAHQDLSPDGKLLMPLLAELSESEPRMRVRQRLNFIISELAEIGFTDPRGTPGYSLISTSELLESTKSMRWNKNSIELQAIGKELRKRSQNEINSVVTAWEQNAAEMNPTFPNGPTLNRHLTLERVVAELGPTSVIPLIAMLKNPQVAHVRRAVVEILKLHQDRRCIEPLRAAISDGLGREDFREQAAILLEIFKEVAPDFTIDPSVIRTIKKVVVSNPYAHNYLDFRRYEAGLIEVGESVVEPLNQEILLMQVPTKEIGTRLHDIGGTPARVLSGLAKEESARNKVNESIDSMLAALRSKNDKVPLETKWYLVCVLAELTESLEKQSHPLRSHLGLREEALSQSLSQLEERSAQVDAVYRQIRSLQKVWETWKPSDDPFQ